MTECSYFASVGQKDCFKDLDVEKYEIVATLDNKTSHICQEMDGKVFDMKDYEPGITAPPFHVFCRSTTAPYFDDEEAYGERVARDHAGNVYYVPSDMTYGEWKELCLSNKASSENNNRNQVIIPKNYKEDNNEINIAKTLSDRLGINVELLKKTQKFGIKNPDAKSDKEFYEFKTPKSIKGIDGAIRSGIKQVAENSGKVVVDIKNCTGSIDEIKKIIQNRVNRTLDNKELEVLLIDSVKKEIISIDKYNKIRDSYSRQEGAKGISYYSNNTINEKRSQLLKSENNVIIPKGHRSNKVIETDHSLIGFYPNSDLLKWTKKVKPEDDYFDVIMHGNNKLVELDYKGQNMTPEKLADRLLKCKGLDKKKIRLLSCSTGLETDEVKECFARKLSKILKRVVIAPNNDVIFKSNGDFRIYKKGKLVEYENGTKK